MNPRILNILNSEEIISILSQIDPNKGRVEHDRYYNGSIGFHNVPITLNFVQRIEERIKPIIGSNIIFQNTFSRIYKKDTTLNFHVDRKDLDVTVSVCLKRDVPWELRVSDIQVQSGFTENDELPYKSSYQGYDIIPGDGVLALGRLYPHWREPMVCYGSQTNIYTFFHWKRT